MPEMIDLRGEDDRDEDFVTDDENLQTDEEDDEFEQETFFERLSALVDIIPPTKRHVIYKSVSNTFSTGFAVSQFAGKGLWVIATSALLVLMPVALEIERESFAIQQENAQMVQAKQAAQIQSEVAQV
ncbi:mitochondrial outer membrane translocase complex, subunit Tom22 [Chytriomyces cf. hyalinus JEL632]|nr:mitochondrial outer membrane translocase complex, subunit Tom22 [Chytriomyces cf. hyalinus JEL632]